MNNFVKTHSKMCISPKKLIRAAKEVNFCAVKYEKKNHSSDTFLNLKCIKSRVTKIIAVLFFFGQITPYPFFSTCTSCWLTLGYLICFYMSFYCFTVFFFRIFFVELLKADLKSRSIKYLLLCEFNLLVTKFWILEILHEEVKLYNDLYIFGINIKHFSRPTLT